MRIKKSTATALFASFVAALGLSVSGAAATERPPAGDAASTRSVATWDERKDVYEAKRVYGEQLLKKAREDH